MQMDCHANRLPPSSCPDCRSFSSHSGCLKEFEDVRLQSCRGRGGRMVNAGCSQCIKKHAECEMAAFLKAAADLVGHRGLLRAGDAWIRAMESLEWPNQNYDKFFRRVAILVISRLLANSDSEAYERKCGPTIKRISKIKLSLSSQNRNGIWTRI